VAATTTAVRTAASGALVRLPLVTLYLTERCNSRCISCDYWRNGKSDVTAESVAAWLPDLLELETQVVLISGGEPLLNPHWTEIAEMLRHAGIRLWLLTSGLSLAKHAARVSRLFESLTVSLDGADAASYLAIRGVDAFEQVCKGIRAATSVGLPPSIRVTVQRGNYRQLPELVALAKRLGVLQVSFLAADVANAHAFGRIGASAGDVALHAEDLPILERVLDEMEREHAADYRCGYIAESPLKMRRILQYYAALCGRAAFPATRCNAPEFSAVIAASGRVHPCFFIQGAESADANRGFASALNSAGSAAVRGDIRNGLRAECRTCVCHMWRDPAAAATWEAAATRPHGL
jgi:MoaA/NifB/PqqE/SkfB family radical SAM enzyme